MQQGNTTLSPPLTCLQIHRSRECSTPSFATGLGKGGEANRLGCNCKAGWRGGRRRRPELPRSGAVGEKKSVQFSEEKRKKKRKEKKKETFISGHCLNGLGQPFHALTLISKKGLEPPVTLVGLNCFWFSFQKSEKEGDWGRGTNTPRPIRKCALTGGQGEGEGGPEGLNFYFCLKSMTPGSSKNPQY